MNETTRTVAFVVVASVLAAVAYGTHLATRPASLDDFSDVGDEFFPDFTEPREATGLRVAAYNDEAARVDVFNVENRDGRWRIPSHHNYPADGEEQLAKTATSIIGLKREALVSTSRDDHKRLGVLDPLDESVTGTEGRGDRITLTKADQTLADYIIGNKIEDGPENTYNVRAAGEDRTYRATLVIDISTKFADWIEPDLLDFRRGDIRELVIDRYSIDETRGVLVPGEVSKLSKPNQNDPWQLEGLDEAAGKVKVSSVNTAINALEDLAIVGVRPKPSGLSADLKGEGDGAIDTRAVIDLEQKGFFIAGGALVSNEGEVRMALSDGAMYVLRFGEVFTGSDVEIEVGSSGGETASSDADSASDAAEADADAAAEGDADSSDESDSGEGDDSLKKSRYLFITAQFEESFIEPLPEKPVKPEPPEGAALEDDNAESDKEGAEGDAASPETDDKNEGEAEAADDASDATDGDADTAEEAQENEPDPKAEYEKALNEYETALAGWEQKKEDREQKITDGKKRVQELNERFADWYYVISARTFDDIRVSPEDLIDPAEPEAQDDDVSTPEAEMPEEKTDAKDDAAPAKSEDEPAPKAEEEPAEPTKEAPSTEKDTPEGSTEEANSADSEPESPEAVEDVSGNEGTPGESPVDSE